MAQIDEKAPRTITREELERAALEIINVARGEHGHPTVATFDGFDDGTVRVYQDMAKSAIATLGITVEGV